MLKLLRKTLTQPYYSFNKKMSQLSQPRTAVIIGGAECVWDDLSRYDGPMDGVIAANCIGTAYPGDLTAWASLHARNFPRYVRERRENGYEPTTTYGNGRRGDYTPDVVTEPTFPGHGQGGSSGLFAAKVALIDLGFDRVVFCGVPLTPTRHALDYLHIKAEDYIFTEAHNYQKSWRNIPEEYIQRMRSMSGWTERFLGCP